MSDLESLYREIIMDHNRSPRNKGELPPPAHKAEGFNPLCGDEIEVYLLLGDDPNGGDAQVIADIKIGGQGCSISQSSASMMSVLVKGKTVDEAHALMGRFKTMLTIDGNDAPADVTAEDIRALGDVASLQGVMQFPTRIKCATLSWNTLDQAFQEATNV